MLFFCNANFYRLVKLKESKDIETYYIMNTH